MSDIKDLIVIAERVDTGEKVIGYVCGCPHCQNAYEDDPSDRTRPQGLLTNHEGKYGGIKVYTDTMQFFKFSGMNNN